VCYKSASFLGHTVEVVCGTSYGSAELPGAVVETQREEEENEPVGGKQRDGPKHQLEVDFAVLRD